MAEDYEDDLAVADDDDDEVDDLEERVSSRALPSRVLPRMDRMAPEAVSEPSNSTKPYPMD